MPTQTIKNQSHILKTHIYHNQVQCCWMQDQYEYECISLHLSALESKSQTKTRR